MKKIGKKTMMVLLVAGLIAAALPMAVMGEVALSEDTDVGADISIEEDAALEEGEMLVGKINKMGSGYKGHF